MQVSIKESVEFKVNEIVLITKGGNIELTEMYVELNLFDSLFKNLKNYKYWLLSYNNSSYPDKDQLIKIISVYSNDIQIIERKHNYQITGKDKKEKNKEFLFIIKNKNYD